MLLLCKHRRSIQGTSHPHMVPDRPPPLPHKHVTPWPWCIKSGYNYAFHKGTYLRFNGPFPREPGLVGPPHFLPWLCLEQNPWDKWHWLFYRPDVLPIIQPTVSTHWRKFKALTPTSGLASNFLHIPLDSWGKSLLVPLCWVSNASNCFRQKVKNSKFRGKLRALSSSRSFP